MIARQEAIPVEHPVDRTLRLMRKAAKRAERREHGPLLGIGAIKQMLGEKSRETVLGYLIKLVARGEVEVLQCTNGTYWAPYLAPQPVIVRPEDVTDGFFILQREIFDGPRSSWFDAETFTNSIRAGAALRYAKANGEYRAREWNSPDRRIQRVRLVSLPKLGQPA